MTYTAQVTQLRLWLENINKKQVRLDMNKPACDIATALELTFDFPGTTTYAELVDMIIEEMEARAPE